MEVHTLNDDEVRAWGGYLRTHARIMRELDEELRAAHGMPLGTFDVLINLALAPEEMLRMRDLADAIVLSRSGLTQAGRPPRAPGPRRAQALRRGRPGSVGGAYPDGTARARRGVADALRRRAPALPLARSTRADQARLGDLWDKLKAEDLTATH